MTNPLLPARGLQLDGKDRLHGLLKGPGPSDVASPYDHGSTITWTSAHLARKPRSHAPCRSDCRLLLRYLDRTLPEAVDRARPHDAADRPLRANPLSQRLPYATPLAGQQRAAADAAVLLREKRGWQGAIQFGAFREPRPSAACGFAVGCSHTAGEVAPCC